MPALAGVVLTAFTSHPHFCFCFSGACEEDSLVFIGTEGSTSSVTVPHRVSPTVLLSPDSIPMARTEAQKSQTNALRRDVSSSLIFKTFQRNLSDVVVSSRRRIIKEILAVVGEW